jgi:predicted RNA-binding Zn-ribbon protein involved in translation (DUF1610 family)
MTGTDALVIRFQCPKCGHELEQTIGSLKLSNHMRCRDVGSELTSTQTDWRTPPRKCRAQLKKCLPRSPLSSFNRGR